jgi:hypothetical protein
VVGSDWWKEAIMPNHITHLVIGIVAGIGFLAVAASTIGGAVAFTPVEAPPREGKYYEKKAPPDAGLKNEREDVASPSKGSQGDSNDSRALLGGAGVNAIHIETKTAQ